jgi:hypothetical protein
MARPARAVKGCGTASRSISDPTARSSPIPLRARSADEAVTVNLLQSGSSPAAAGCASALAPAYAPRHSGMAGAFRAGSLSPAVPVQRDERAVRYDPGQMWPAAAPPFCAASRARCWPGQGQQVRVPARPLSCAVAHVGASPRARARPRRWPRTSAVARACVCLARPLWPSFRQEPRSPFRAGSVRGPEVRVAAQWHHQSVAPRAGRRCSTPAAGAGRMVRQSSPHNAP